MSDNTVSLTNTTQKHSHTGSHDAECGHELVDVERALRVAVFARLAAAAPAEECRGSVHTSQAKERPSQNT